MIGVLGGGYGLYGHLTAIVEEGLPVCTLQRYRSRILTLPGGQDIDSFVQYVGDEEQILERAQMLVVARRPEDHVRIAEQILADPASRRITALVIEKPMAASPHAAERLVGELEAKELRVHVPFLFPYCSWHKKILSSMDPGRINIGIDWAIPKRNSSQSWKYHELLGGGILNYYLINLFPTFMLLADNKKFTIQDAEWEDDYYRFSLVSRTSELSLSFRYADLPSFRVEIENELVFIGESPFSSPITPGERDPRVDFLRLFYHDIWPIQKGESSSTKAVLEIWKLLWDHMPHVQNG